MTKLRFLCTQSEYNHATLEQKRDWNRRFLARAREERILAAECQKDRDEDQEGLCR
jgi:hypothetical protein